MGKHIGSTGAFCGGGFSNWAVEEKDWGKRSGGSGLVEDFRQRRRRRREKKGMMIPCLLASSREAYPEMLENGSGNEGKFA